MIDIGRCYERKCKHFIGVKNDRTDNEPELNERLYCEAYPNKIPDDIAYGTNLHLTVRPDQDNKIVFEKEQVIHIFTGTSEEWEKVTKLVVKAHKGNKKAIKELEEMDIFNSKSLPLKGYSLPDAE